LKHLASDYIFYFILERSQHVESGYNVGHYVKYKELYVKNQGRVEPDSNQSITKA
jgi:hypothetical protein